MLVWRNANIIELSLSISVSSDFMVLFMLKNFFYIFPLPFGELSMVGLDIDLVVFQCSEHGGIGH